MSESNSGAINEAPTREEVLDRFAAIFFDKLERDCPTGRSWDTLGAERGFFVAAIERVLNELANESDSELILSVFRPRRDKAATGTARTV